MPIDYLLNFIMEYLWKVSQKVSSYHGPIEGQEPTSRMAEPDLVSINMVIDRYCVISVACGTAEITIGLCQHIQKSCFVPFGPCTEKEKHSIQSVMLRKPRDEKLTMATFETMDFAPEVIAITAPLSEKELRFYGSPCPCPCPCDKNIYNLLRKAGQNGLEGLTIDELQFIQKHLSEASANILEQMGQQTGVLQRTQPGDRLSLLRRIAELEGNLLNKQKQTQRKIAEMQDAVKLEKDRLTELRQKLEMEKGPSSRDTNRQRINKDVAALEEMKIKLRQKLNAELVNKMELEKKLSKRSNSPSLSLTYTV